MVDLKMDEKFDARFTGDLYFLKAHTFTDRLTDKYTNLGLDFKNEGKLPKSAVFCKCTECAKVGQCPHGLACGCNVKKGKCLCDVIGACEKNTKLLVENLKTVVTQLVAKKQEGVGDLVIDVLKEDVMLLARAGAEDKADLDLIDNAIKIMAWHTFFLSDQTHLNKLLEAGDQVARGEISDHEVIEIINKYVEDNEHVKNGVYSIIKNYN